jgi:hypothetical protein
MIILKHQLFSCAAFHLVNLEFQWCFLNCGLNFTYSNKIGHFWIWHANFWGNKMNLSYLKIFDIWKEQQEEWHNLKSIIIWCCAWWNLRVPERKVETCKPTEFAYFCILPFKHTSLPFMRIYHILLRRNSNSFLLCGKICGRFMS